MSLLTLALGQSVHDKEEAAIDANERSLAKLRAKPTKNLDVAVKRLTQVLIDGILERLANCHLTSVFGKEITFDSAIVPNDVAEGVKAKFTKLGWKFRYGYCDGFNQYDHIHLTPPASYWENLVGRDLKDKLL